MLAPAPTSSPGLAQSCSAASRTRPATGARTYEHPSRGGASSSAPAAAVAAAEPPPKASSRSWECAKEAEAEGAEGAEGAEDAEGVPSADAVASSSSSSSVVHSPPRSATFTGKGDRQTVLQIHISYQRRLGMNAA